MPQISIIVPLFNESAIFPQLIERLNQLMEKIPLSIGVQSDNVEVVLVNDGSSDDTETLMHQVALADPRYHCVFLARNYGHQIALSAGLQKARGTEGVMVIDGDLQDPPELLTDFYGYLKKAMTLSMLCVKNGRKMPSNARLIRHFTAF